MSDLFPERPAPDDYQYKFAIVASEYNGVFVKALVAHATNELLAIHRNAIIASHSVPGAFEIPFAVQEVAIAGQADAVIALGVIIRGATMHADLIGNSVTEALQQITLKYRVPVVHEVLLLNDETQARQRCLDEKANRGTEAARSASRMAVISNEFKSRR